MERVVITGLGAISALGIGREENFNQAMSGVSGIGWLSLPDGRAIPGCAVAQIHETLPDLLKKSERSLFDRYAELAWIAASEALTQAGISRELDDRTQSGVFWGTGMGGAQTLENSYVSLFTDAGKRIRPLAVVAGMNNAAAGQIALKCGFGGTVNTYSSACVSSAQAIGEAFRHIRHGYANRILAGGSDALLTYGVISAWDAMHVMATPPAGHPEQACRPFDKQRSGLVLGEAGAAVMLESLSSATRRGATILAELVGYGASNDATHMTNPDPAGQARAMWAALDDARLAATDVGYINAHGAGTLAGDLAETESIKLVFGEHARHLMISSTKSMHGHTLGAAAALEFVLTVETLRRGAVPPTAFLENPDPGCDLDYVARIGRTGQSVRVAMSNSFAFGGTNAVLVARQFDAAA